MGDMNDEYRTLTERRDWLTARIAAKQSVGWDTAYDTRERDALTWALTELHAAVPLTRIEDDS